MMQKAKKVIPSSCQIGDTFFSHMAVIGNDGDLVSKHIDRDDFITVLFYTGQLLYSSEVNY